MENRTELPHAQDELAGRVYYATVAGPSYGGGWAVADNAAEALRQARRHVGASARTERGSYTLEFPAGADVRCLSELDGGWRANVHPLRVVQRHKIPATITDDNLLGR